MPYRKEIERYQKSIRARTYTPIYFDKDRKKIDNLKELLERNANTVTTHALFLSIYKEAAELIKKNKYQLIIDEAIHAVSVISTEKTRMNVMMTNSLMVPLYLQEMKYIGY